MGLATALALALHLGCTSGTGDSDETGKDTDDTGEAVEVEYSGPPLAVIADGTTLHLLDIEAGTTTDIGGWGWVHTLRISPGQGAVAYDKGEDTVVWATDGSGEVMAFQASEVIGFASDEGLLATGGLMSDDGVGLLWFAGESAGYGIVLFDDTPYAEAVTATRAFKSPDGGHVVFSHGTDTGSRVVVMELVEQWHAPVESLDVEGDLSGCKPSYLTSGEILCADRDGFLVVEPDASASRALEVDFPHGGIAFPGAPGKVLVGATPAPDSDLCPSATWDTTCIVEVDLATGEHRALAGLAAAGRINTRTLQASPDGSTLLFAAGESVYRASSSGRGLEQLVTASRAIEDLAW